MADWQPDIERIVREVLQRLQSHGSVEAANGQTGDGEVADGQAAEDAESPSDSKAELRLPDRVVTLAKLDGRLEGVQRIVVPHKAVITPAVRDELRRQNVTLVRCDASPRASETRDELWIGVAANNFNPAALIQAMDHSGITVGQVGNGDVQGQLLETTQQLVTRIRGHQQRTVLLTTEPAVALCVANRSRGVRAALGTDVASVSAAVAAIGSNLLVVDPTARSVYELRSMLQEFHRGGQRDCPPQYRELLE
jgi:ribose 5-phosphate isomerase RpiB